MKTTHQKILILYLFIMSLSVFDAKSIYYNTIFSLDKDKINHLSDTEQDSLALVALFNATNGYAWNNSANWLSGNLETWYGITLNSEKRVITIALNENNLSGTIPPEFGNLTMLDSLNLYLNNLSGELPSEFAYLQELRSLTLWDNQFSGAFPEQLFSMSKLEYLDLDGNQFTGTIPPGIANLQSLKNIYLGNNPFTGNIPVEIFYLSKLEILGIYDTQISGSIPPGIGNLPNLVSLFLSGNQLSGVIPETIYNLYNLQVLSLSRNLLTGGISSSVVKLSKLRQLLLWGNQLSGSIPSAIGQLPNLQYLQLGDNLLYGELPPEIGDLSSLLNLDLRNNQHSGNLPASLGNLSNLQTFNLVNNQLSGPIPPEYGNLSQLLYLDLGANPLQCNIPAELGNLNNLQRMYLANAQLVGEIPSNLGNLSSLIALALDKNSLTGQIPYQLGQLNSLQGLYLQSNQLSGIIPHELGNLANLNALFLSGNQISGEIPIELGNLLNLTQLVLNNNQLTGTVPSEVNNLSNMYLLDLSTNFLSGLPKFDKVPFNMDANSGLLLQNNLFTFHDLEKNAYYLNYQNKYSPQAKVHLNETSRLVNYYEYVNLDAELLTNDTLISGNTYFSWYRNSELVAGPSVTSTYNINSFTDIDAGYYYCLMNNSLLDSLQLVTDSIYINTAVSAPEAPSDVSLSALSSSEIKINWQDNSSLENGFEIYRSTESGINYSIIFTTAANVNNYTDVGLSPSTTYYYQIRAFNGSGYSNFTEEKAIATLGLSTAPNAPTGLTANAVSDTQIDLSWIDNSDNEDGYKFYISNDGINYSYFGSVGSNETSLSSRLLTANTTYYYFVGAYNAFGENFSQTVAATTFSNTTAPNAPTNFAADALSGTSIKLTWTDVAFNEEGFYVYRSIDNQNFSQEYTLGANEIFYLDNGLKPSTTYYYYVCAYNAFGSACTETLIAFTPSTTMPTVYNGTACQGALVNYVNADGSGIRWYSDASLSNFVSSGNYYYPSTSNSGVFYYYVTQDLGGFESDAAVATFTVFSLPYANAGPDIVTCEYESQIEANKQGANASGIWEIIVGNGSISNYYSNSITYSDPNRINATLSWTIVDQNNCTNSDQVKIVFNPLPQVPNIHVKGGFVFICTGPDMKAYRWFKNGNEIAGETAKYYVERNYMGNTYAVVVQNDFGCFNYSQINYKSELADNYQIQLYPMPSKNKVYLSAENKELSIIEANILDQFGHVKKSIYFENQQLFYDYELDISALIQGYYVLELIFSDGERVYKKIIKE